MDLKKIFMTMVRALNKRKGIPVSSPGTPVPAEIPAEKTAEKPSINPVGEPSTLQIMEEMEETE